MGKFLVTRFLRNEIVKHVYYRIFNKRNMQSDLGLGRSMNVFDVT